MILRPLRSTLFPYTTLFRSSWMRVYAEKEGLNLSECYSYSDSMSDLPMLSVVGHPTAVNPDFRLDRKSTRLNSSHMSISYAVFCLKKKKNHRGNDHTHTCYV